jgi:hypothetical protein
VFAYTILFSIPIILTQISGIDDLGDKLSGVWTSLFAWIAHHVLGVSGPIITDETGSGDRIVDWVAVGCDAALAALATVVWSIADRRRASYPRLLDGLRTGMRYTLAFVMLGYGVIKLFGGQFPAPGLRRLLERFGDASPMGMLWTFMGSSKAYVIFSGFGETLGAVLVLFRRTTTLGALVLGAGAGYVVDAERIQADKMPLTTRGFHLVSEIPFNR